MQSVTDGMSKLQLKPRVARELYGYFHVLRPYSPFLHLNLVIFSCRGINNSKSGFQFILRLFR